jgi:V/A-type H+-transporting ATPase subunit A
VPEGIFTHRIMVPFNFYDTYTVKWIAEKGQFTVEDTVAEVEDSRGETHKVTMMFEWPVKRAIDVYAERLKPSTSMITKVRIIDTFIPVALGGTYCIPGPFGAGKTVLQQITSRNAEVDIVIITACGERAGEVVETLKEFPELIDPRTGRTLMERTVIVVNTSSMPVAARDASVYTGITIAEYYRQMGLNVLLLADSTSRWAQAMREMSGRLEEIPGEEAFPAYLESVIAGFYERAGVVKLKDGSQGSVTVGGTVSPAGGNFEEPVTQSTLKVVGAFHGLSRDRAEARKYPSIDPLESWSKYPTVVNADRAQYARDLLREGNEVGQMMKVVGEEGTSTEDFIVHMKAEFLDAVYLQQNAFDPVDAAVSAERQRHVFGVMFDILTAKLDMKAKDEVRSFFNSLRQKFLDYNGSEWNSDDFKSLENEIRGMVEEKSVGIEHGAQHLLEETNA